MGRAAREERVLAITLGEEKGNKRGDPMEAVPTKLEEFLHSHGR